MAPRYGLAAREGTAVDIAMQQLKARVVVNP